MDQLVTIFEGVAGTNLTDLNSILTIESCFEQLALKRAQSF